MSTVRGRALRVAGKITTKNERKNNQNTVASKAFNAEITGVNRFFSSEKSGSRYDQSDNKRLVSESLFRRGIAFY